MFHLDCLALEHHHLAKLVQGDNIRLKHNQLQGPVSIHLTKVQWNKLRKVRANGKGMTLKMSTVQVRHNLQHGEGIWDTITGIYDKVAPVAKALYPVAKAGYEAYKFFRGGTIEEDEAKGMEYVEAHGGSSGRRPRTPAKVVAKSKAEHDVLSSYGIPVEPWVGARDERTHSPEPVKAVKLTKAIRESLRQLPPTQATVGTSASADNPAIGFQLTGTGLRIKRHDE